MWFSQHGVASVFILCLGTVQVCNMSAAVTIICIGQFIGSTVRLSVSRRWNVFVCWSSSCTMYESNFNFVKSEY